MDRSTNKTPTPGALVASLGRECMIRPIASD